VAVMPDTQVYAAKYPKFFEAQTKWIADHRLDRRIACALHLGDITEHNTPNEWEVARRCFGMLDGRVPYVLVPGNHDYSGTDRKTLLNQYFPVAEMKQRPAFGGVFAEGRLDNSFHLVRIGKQNWIVLALEYGPRDEVVAWANKVLSQYPERLGILVTHAYLFHDSTRFDHKTKNQRGNPHAWGNDGEQLWRKLVRRHRNMMLVVSGHVATGGLGYLASQGEHGNAVHQMLVDYQKSRKGGEAFMRLLEFLPDGKTVQAKSYSPALDRYKTDPQNQFTFTLKPARDSGSRSTAAAGRSSSD
jgi:hypothetical protein